MKRKIIWLTMGCLVALVLVLASCGPAATTTPPTTAPPTTTPPTTAPPTTPVKEKAQYGGTLTTAFRTSPLQWDERYGGLWIVNAIQLTNEPLLIGDWAKGPAGTGETAWLSNPFPWPKYMRGCLAESWKIVDDRTIEFVIRKGVYWQSLPPVNGREMGAYDCKYSLLRLYKWTDTYHYLNFPWKEVFESIKATDKWHLTIKSAPGALNRVWDCAVASMGAILPKEIDTYYPDPKGGCSDGRGSSAPVPFISLTSFPTVPLPGRGTPTTG